MLEFSETNYYQALISEKSIYSFKINIFRRTIKFEFEAHWPIFILSQMNNKLEVLKMSWLINDFHHTPALLSYILYPGGFEFKSKMHILQTIANFTNTQNFIYITQNIQSLFSLGSPSNHKMH